MRAVRVFEDIGRRRLDLARRDRTASERARFSAAIDAGLEDEASGRVVSHEEVVAEMQRRAAKRKPER
jgi:predicted transcriptional regulator